MNPDELKSIAVLQSIDADALARLAAALEDRKYADGEVVFAEGDPGDSMYFLVEGRVRIEKRSQASGAPPKVLAVLEAGDYFGEMALLDQKPRSGAAVVAGGARILRLAKQAFGEIQRQSSAAAMSVLFAMIRTSSERIRRLSAQLVVYDEVGKALGEARDLQALSDVILQQLASATAADWGLLLLCSPFSEQLECRAQLNLALSPAQLAAVRNGCGFIRPTLQDMQARLVEDFDADDLSKSCERLGFETPSLLLSPVTLEGKLLGLLILGGRERAQFGLDALNLSRGISRQAAQAILNARHREEEEARSRHSRQFVRF